MSVINQFSYYRKETRKYMKLIREAQAVLTSNVGRRKWASLEYCHMENLVCYVFYNLKRITNFLDNEKHVKGGDLLSVSYEINLVKSEIEKDIVAEIERKGFKVTCNDGKIHIARQNRKGQ